MPVERLRDTEKRILNAIDDHWRQCCCSPSYAEIAALGGFSSTGHLSKQLDWLVTNGYLIRTGSGKSRQVVPPWVAAAIRNADKPTRRVIKPR